MQSSQEGESKTLKAKIMATDQPHRNRRRRVNTGEETSMAGQLLGLSLFIMLLAFFIVLNAISQYEITKFKPIMESLNYTFASRISTFDMDDRPSETQDEDTKSINEGATVEKLQALFSAQLPGYESVVSVRKGEMYIRLPYDEFKGAVMAVGQRNALDDAQGIKTRGNFFLPTMVALMRSDKGGITFRMDMVLNIGEDPATLQNNEPQKLLGYMKNMGQIAQQIETAGLPARFISSGLEKGEDGIVEIIFRYHTPYNPLTDGGYDGR